MKTLFLLLLMTATAIGQDNLPVRTIKTKADGVKTLNAAISTPAGADITWEIIEPIDKQFVAKKDGRSIAFFMDSDRRVVVLCDVIDWVGKKRIKTKTVVTSEDPDPPGPDPDPDPPTPPDPVVPPSGFAGEVFRQAKQINRPADSLRMSNVFESVAARIAAGGFTTLEQVSVELSRQNDELNLDPVWRSFGTWLSNELSSRAQNLPQSKEIFEQVAIGLKAAGR